jgi:hypothetical protein
MVMADSMGSLQEDILEIVSEIAPNASPEETRAMADVLIASGRRAARLDPEEAWQEAQRAGDVLVALPHGTTFDPSIVMNERQPPDAGEFADAVEQRVRDLSEQVFAQAKKNGLTFLKGYERVLKNMLDLEEQAAKVTGQDWATTLASTHANFVRETSNVFIDAARDRLK